MGAQALSGIAKDLNKMSAKSSVKSLVSEDQQNQLFKWVALLTGSKNALKGIGFFLGGALLVVLGFQHAVLAMAMVLALVWLASLCLLKQDLGKAKNKPKFSDIFSKSRAVNMLSVARLFLFGARDIWFVVALPVFLSSQLNWDFWQVGIFLAAWVIGYGMVQSAAPFITSRGKKKNPDGRSALWWALALTFVTVMIAFAMHVLSSHAPSAQNFSMPNLWQTNVVLIVGLCVFGIIFAINSSLHSYLIVSYAKEDGASMDVGFYYMANALGRLIGTLLSGWIYQSSGMVMCLWASAAFIAIAACLSTGLPTSAQTHVNE
jgi:predicted MFS family arabinose efflux permease